MALLIPDAATAWDEEIQRRVDALEAGTEKLESWESVKRRIATDILGPVTRRFRNLKAAREEFSAAVRWYEQQRPGLGGEFFDAVVQATSLIQAQPEIGTPSQDRRTRLTQLCAICADSLFIPAAAHDGGSR